MIRNRKAVETAALWKPWRTVTSRSRPMHRFFHRSHSAWKTARGARSFPTVTHRFCYWTYQQERRFRIDQLRGPRTAEPVNERPAHGLTANPPRPAGRTASSRRPSQGLKCVQGEDITTRSLAGFDPALSAAFDVAPDKRTTVSVSFSKLKRMLLDSPTFNFSN